MPCDIFGSGGEEIIAQKSFVSHIVHDEVIVDLHDEDRDLVPEIEKVFSNNKLGYFKTNICAGKNYYDLGVLKI